MHTVKSEEDTHFPTFSVIITIWNLERYLAETLNSVENQSVKPLEVLLIDDGSTDSSIDIARAFIQNKSNYKLFKLPHTGVSNARNFGLNLVKSEYVIFLDGDDILLPNYFQELIKRLKNKPDIVITSSFEFDDKTKIKNELHWFARKDYLPLNCEPISTSSLTHVMFYTFMGWAWDKVFNVQFIRQNKLYFPELRNSEDLVFTYSALLLSENISIILTPLILHRVGRTSSLSNSRAEAIFDSYEAIKLVDDFLKKNQDINLIARKNFNEWSVDFVLWATKGKFSDYVTLKSAFPRIDWNSIECTKNEFYSGLTLLLLASKLFGFQSKIFKMFYLFYWVRKYGLKRTICRALSKIISKI